MSWSMTRCPRQFLLRFLSSLTLVSSVYGRGTANNPPFLESGSIVSPFLSRYSNGDSALSDLVDSNRWNGEGNIHTTGPISAGYSGFLMPFSEESRRDVSRFDDFLSSHSSLPDFLSPIEKMRLFQTRKRTLDQGSKTPIVGRLENEVKQIRRFQRCSKKTPKFAANLAQKLSSEIAVPYLMALAKQVKDYELKERALTLMGTEVQQTQCEGNEPASIGRAGGETSEPVAKKIPLLFLLSPKNDSEKEQHRQMVVNFLTSQLQTAFRYLQDDRRLFQSGTSVRRNRETFDLCVQALEVIAKPDDYEVRVLLQRLQSNQDLPWEASRLAQANHRIFNRSE